MIQLRLSVMLFFILILLGCIPVDDLGEYWEKGFVDEELIGDWKRAGDYAIDNQYLSIRNVDGTMVARMINPRSMDDGDAVPLLCRTLIAGNQKYLMIDGRQQQIDQNRDSFAKIQDLVAEGKLQEDEQFRVEQQKKFYEIEKSPRFGGVQLYRVEGGRLTTYQVDGNRVIELIDGRKEVGRIKKADQNDFFAMDQVALAPMNPASIELLTEIANDESCWKSSQVFDLIENLVEDLDQAVNYAPQDSDGVELILDQTDLEYFCNGKIEILRRHLQADPEWKVFQEGRTDLLAIRRIYSDEGWRMGSNGYLSSKVSPFHAMLNAKETRPGWSEQQLADAYQVRTLFRFTAEPWNPNVFSAPPRNFMRVEPDAGRISLKLKESDQGLESHLSVGREGLWFEFFEQAAVEDRKRTRAELDWLKKFLAKVQQSEDEIQREGFTASLIDPQFIGSGQPSMSIRTGHWPSLFYINAFVNPGQQGYVFLKARDKGNGRYLDDRNVGWDNKEYIGWSDNPEVLFHYNTRVSIPESTMEAMSQMQFELWFRPGSGEPEQSWFEYELRETDIKLVENPA